MYRAKMLKKRNLIILLAGAILLALAIVLKISKFTPTGREESSGVESDLLSSEVVSDLLVSSQLPLNPESAIISEATPEVSVAVETGFDGQEDLAQTMKDAAWQILLTGGVWTQDGNNTVQLVFSRDSFTITGIESPAVEVSSDASLPAVTPTPAPAQSYQIQTAAFSPPEDEAVSVYAVTLTDGRSFAISAYGENRYVLRCAELFPELGDSAVFSKTAVITFSNQPPTDEAADLQTVTGG